jgi:hypothetical protein
MSKVIKIKYYSVDLLNSKLDHLFIFGDNLIGKGLAGQAIIRNCVNSYGIPTKKYPSNKHGSFFDDSEYEENIKHIKNAIDNIPKGYEYIVFPTDGLGTGLAGLPTKAPKTFTFLNKYINDIFGKIYEF